MAQHSPEQTPNPRGPANWLMRFSLRGLPELDLFESEEDRERAIAEIGRQAGNVKTGGYWIGLVLFVSAVFAVLRFSKLLYRLVDWPAWVIDVARFSISALVCLWVLRALHRWGTRADLRQILLNYGIPVCLACGYSLRGLREDSAACPECGRSIPDFTRTLIDAQLKRT